MTELEVVVVKVAVSHPDSPIGAAENGFLLAASQTRHPYTAYAPNSGQSDPVLHHSCLHARITAITLRSALSVCSAAHQPRHPVPVQPPSMLLAGVGYLDCKA